MSLIQDALKRKTEENPEASSQPAAPPPPPRPAPAASRPSATPARPASAPKEPKKPGRIVAILLFPLMLLVAGGGAYYFLLYPKQPAEESIAEATEQPAPQPEATPQPPPEPEPIPEPPKPAAIWPELIYSGSAAGDNEAVAIINGRFLSEGNSIDGVVILKIGKTDVLVEFEGEQRTLRIENL